SAERGRSRWSATRCTARCVRSRTGHPLTPGASPGLPGPVRRARRAPPSRFPIVPGLAPGVSEPCPCCRESRARSRTVTDPGRKPGVARKASRMRLGRIGYINCYPVYGAIDRGATPLAAELVTGTPSELNDLLAAG